VRVAVVGAGVVGMAAAAHLAERGDDVVCYEAMPGPMTVRSAGSTRIFRLAHGSAEMVELAAVAKAGFGRWSEQAGERLVGGQTCVVTGADVEAWAAAMDAAGAAHDVVSALSSSGPPARSLPAPVLVDRAGGVIDVDAVRSHLSTVVGRRVIHEPVHALDQIGDAAQVWGSNGEARYDRVVIAAGSGTSPLAQQVGIHTPSALAHHARFSFRLDNSSPARDPSGLPAWIDQPPSGLATYQHRSGPGLWCVGGHLPDADVAWELGQQEAVGRARAAVREYARRNLDVEARVVETLYCTVTPGLGDGVNITRNGPFAAVHGENLFKFAPVIGSLIERALRLD
jgi:sarcosine oxidase